MTEIIAILALAALTAAVWKFIRSRRNRPGVGGGRPSETQNTDKH